MYYLHLIYHTPSINDFSKMRNNLKNKKIDRIHLLRVMALQASG
jgi:hypothetical protein